MDGFMEDKIIKTEIKEMIKKHQNIYKWITEILVSLHMPCIININLQMDFAQILLVEMKRLMETISKREVKNQSNGSKTKEKFIDKIL